MDESDLQAHFGKNRNPNELFFYTDDVTVPIDRLKSLVSLLDSGNIHDALRVYIRTYSSDFHKTERLAILVDGIANQAREIITKNKIFSADLFVCYKCSDIMNDPVTLKCGHTFSKKCILSEAENDSFTCPKCSESYCFTYLSQLKNNVAIISLVEKLIERNLLRLKSKMTAANENSLDKKYEADAYLISNRDSELLDVESPSLLHATSLGFCKKGNIFLNFGNFKEAFKAYLTSYTLDSNALYAKMSAIEVLSKLLQNMQFPSSKSVSTESTNLSGSSDSLHVEDDGLSSDEEEIKVEADDCDSTDLQITIDSFFDFIRKIEDETCILSRIDSSCMDKKEFECPLCMRLLWEPVTTTCGHTFCRVCLNRCFDHQPTCPLCKASLSAILAERVQNTTEFLELAIKNLFPSDYAERQAIYLEELEELSNAGKDPEHEIPLFVCTVALPTVPCPLHVFEPRYRLMIRQCMESGSRQFGMCGVVDEEIAEYGTMLEIRDVEYFPDGRSIVDTVGSKRFRVLRRGERDGYHTGAIEFLEDQTLNDDDLQSIEEKHNRTYKISKVWFMHLPADTRHQILQHFGPMPHVETNYTSSPDGPSWLWWMLAILPVETRLKVLLISLTSLPRRLEFLNRILLHFQSAIIS